MTNENPYVPDDATVIEDTVVAGTAAQEVARFVGPHLTRG